MNSLTVILSLSGLFLTCLVSVGILLHWHLQCRQDHPPVREKLMREAGERLRRRLECLEKRTLLLLLGGTLVPLTLLLGGLAIADSHYGNDHPALILVFTIGGFIATLGAAGWGLQRTLTERRSARRSLIGERIVAENLSPLIVAGHHIFHDVPTKDHDPSHNLHHVVVGPAGILAIETRTFGKRRAIAGRKPNEILFDGTQIVHPWGQDGQGLGTARLKADWLSDWIYQITGKRVTVTPVLTFPGWWVNTTVSREVDVHNPRQIAALMRHTKGNVIEPQLIELIVDQLQVRCRDVEL
ncbi:MAG: nuclease-related domain-containing protein [Opitutaceae bacterium]|jgi:hypothetical protein